MSACLLAALPSFAQTNLLQKANDLELKGDFKEAGALLSKALETKSLDPAQKKQLEFDLDRLDRIKKDFPFTKDSLYDALKISVKDLTPAEYDQWVKQGRFDSREIDGTRYFMGDSVRNLFFRYTELLARRTPPKSLSSDAQARWESCFNIRKAAMVQGKPYVLPKKFQVTMTVTAEADAAPAGQTIRAWIPVPRRYPFQEGFEVVASSPQVKQLDSEDSPIRSAYFEQVTEKDKPTEFKIEYNYTAYGVFFDIKPAEVRPCDPNDPALAPYLREVPHIQFSPEIRALSQKIVGNETNAYRKAKKCYDWIADNINYSYAIEYSTIRNISEYCRSRGYGDCGQEALLFMTLCRLNGVPARWQSGWNTFPGVKSNHDWSEIYLAPYGWIPVDPYMGIFSMRYATNLRPEQQKEMRDFYFGGLDQYRMIANSDHSVDLRPTKQSIRSDDVDFQRGELECNGKNIYLDKFSYSLTYREIKPPQKVD